MSCDERFCEFFGKSFSYYSPQGDHANNLKRHLKAKHPLQHQLVEEADVEVNPVLKKQKIDESKIIKTTKQPLLTSVYGPATKIQRTIIIRMDLETFERACVEMVTTNGCPFRLMNAEGFRKIISPIAKALGTTMDRNKVRDKVLKEYRVATEKLKILMRNSLLFIKLDLATRLETSFLGINVQFYSNGRLRNYTLKVMELSEPTLSAELLTSNLESVLTEVGIPATNLLSITTDNGGNLLKASLLSTQQEPSSDESDCDEDEASDEDEISGQESCEETESQATDDEPEDEVLLVL